MTTPVRAGVVYAICVCVAGCAGLGLSSLTTTTAAPDRARISASDAENAIALGKSTKADVTAALGKTQVIRFDSGFEVWIYQFKDDTPAKTSSANRSERTGSENAVPGENEFVVLFAPSGVVAKTRIRSMPPPREAKGN